MAKKKPLLTKKQLDEFYEDFEEIPVDFETFITDPRYFGSSWVDANGNLTAWDSWIAEGKKIFPIPFRSPYQMLMLAGATGIGKTSFAVNMITGYYLYLTMCLKDPHEYFGLADQKKIVFAFLNIVTKTMAYKNAWGMIHTALLKSPWFMERGVSTGGRRPEWVCTTKPIELLYGNDASQIIGLDIFLAFLDEVSFARIRNIQAAQERAKEVFNAAWERIKSRFTKFGGISEGMMIMASSKRTEQAFLEVFTQKLTSSVEGKRVYVVDKPRWEMHPKGTYSKQTFPVAIGDKFRPPQIIREDEVKEFEENGYKIIRPPVSFYSDFDRDIQTALTNIAGVSVQNTSTFLPGHLVKASISKKTLNPFVQSIIYVGTNDDIQYKDYFDMSRVSQDDFRKPMCIHLDASLGGDGNTISGTVVNYAKQHRNVETDDLVPELHYKQIFKVKVRAPKGGKVMLSKNFQFIMWLWRQGFNIVKVTSDQYQSKQFGQDIAHKGLNYGEQSIDRVTNGINQPYSVLFNAFYENRIEILDDDDQLKELVQLEKYEDGRVDKPEGGSDDASQALCGSVYACSQIKEEYLANHAVLLENTVAAEDPMTEGLPEEVIASLIARQFSDYWAGPQTGQVTELNPTSFVGVPGVQSGMRQEFDNLYGKNKSKDGTAPRQRLHIF